MLRSLLTLLDVSAGVFCWKTCFDSSQVRVCRETAYKDSGLGLGLIPLVILYQVGACQNRFDLLGCAYSTYGGSAGGRGMKVWTH